jgi:hypothetical protein
MCWGAFSSAAHTYTANPVIMADWLPDKSAVAPIGFVLLSLLGACSGGSLEGGEGESRNSSSKASAVQSNRSDDHCFVRVGEVLYHVGERLCGELLPPQRMRGIFVHGWEESSFIPNATTIPRADNRIRFRVDLSGDPAEIARMAGTRLDMRRAQVFAIDMVARRTRRAGAGLAVYVVVVDRIISARYLGLAPVPDFATDAGRDIDLRRPLPEDLWSSSARPE